MSLTADWPPEVYSTQVLRVVIVFMRVCLCVRASATFLVNQAFASW